MTQPVARSTIASYPRQFEAELACGRLVAEGIEAQVVAVRRRGPWRVDVPGELEARAREILNEDHSALLEELFADELAPGEAQGRVCPNCQGGDIADLREEPGILNALLGGRPLWAKRWRCRACDTRWR